MKNKIFIIVLCTIATLFAAIGFAGCGGDNDASADQSYTIMYNDGSESHTLRVKDGELYSIPKPLPSKDGYEFLGLFDEEEGGTQYVTSSGICVTAFADKRNIVLFPHFEAKKIVINLDYGVGVKDGVETITAVYGNNMPNLPSDLVAQDKAKYVFDGWYTEADCKGVKVTGTDGKNPLKSEHLSKWADDKGVVNLYAGFNLVKYSVTFYDCKDFSTEWNGYDSTPLTVKEVEYGTFLSDVAPTKRKNGQTILGWSQSENSATFNGKITKAQNFYVCEYEVTVSYNTDGATSLNPSKASNREELILPKPSRECYEFLYWKDSSGNRVENGMFTEDKTLTAEWNRTHYTVTYNTYDGKKSTRNVKIGDKVPLISVSRQCYQFICWQYLNNAVNAEIGIVMPENDITLTAKWERVSYLVTFEGGKDREVTIGETLSLPNAALKTGYKFVSWVYGGKTYAEGATFKPTDDTYFKADYKALTFTVTLNANGGSVSSTTKTLTFGSSYTLPVPTHQSNIFLGWYTSTSGGTKLTDDTGKSVLNWSTAENVTLYAQWNVLRLVNLDSVSVLGANITISKDDSGVILQGTKTKTYYNIKITIDSGANDAYIYLRNAKINGTSTAAVIGYSVQGSTRPVYLISEGEANYIKAAGGNDGINVSQLTISGTAKLDIYGGAGTTAQKGQNGNNGGIGIRATTLTIEIENAINVTGGNGSVGGTGIAGEKWGKDDWANNAQDGVSGDDGNAGGTGGAGGAAISASTVTVNLPTGITLKLTGGNGGNGGVGGTGGAGQTGGYVGNANATGYSRSGGTGGTGGNGGNGGIGAASATVTNSFKLNSGTCIMQSGKGGAGGKGGTGGAGGVGGKNDFPASRGGAGGKGGDGGTGGTGGTSAATCNITVTKTSIAELTQTEGACGAGGVGGSGGAGGVGGKGGFMANSGSTGASGKKGADGKQPSN